MARHCQPIIAPDSHFNISSEIRISLVSVYESDYRPDPLTVEIQIQLIQGRSMEEALRGLVP